MIGNKRILTGVIIVIGVLALATAGVLWTRHHCSKNVYYLDDAAMPFVRTVITDLSTWQLGRLEKHLSASLLESTSTEALQEELNYTGKLGKLESIGRPVLTRQLKTRSFIYGLIPTGIYSVRVEFDKGSAIVVLEITSTCDQLTVNNLSVNAPSLPRKRQKRGVNLRPRGGPW